MFKRFFLRILFKFFGKPHKKIGRPKGARNKDYPAKEKVHAWKIANPRGTKSACARELGISRPTVIKYWSNS